MTPMRSVYPCRYLHELNSYCTSVQRRIAPSRSPKLIVSSLSKQDQVSDTSITLPSSPSSTKSTTVFPHDFRWNYSQLGAVTPSHRSFGRPSERPAAVVLRSFFPPLPSPGAVSCTTEDGSADWPYPFVCSKETSFSPSVCFVFFWFVIMIVPYANRAGVATLPALALASKPASVKEVIEDFARQCPHETALECVQLIKGRTLRAIFPSANIMEDITTRGLTFRNHPLQFKMPSVSKMVTLVDLRYGIPDGEVKTVLSNFGQSSYIRAETYMGLYTGTRLIKMDIKTAIPSRVTVAGHLCTVFYRGQVRSCFKCGLAGHEAKSCPCRQTAPPGDNVPPSQEEPPPDHGEGVSTSPRPAPKLLRKFLLPPVLFHLHRFMFPLLSMSTVVVNQKVLGR